MKFIHKHSSEDRALNELIEVAEFILSPRDVDPGKPGVIIQRARIKALAALEKAGVVIEMSEAEKTRIGAYTHNDSLI